MKLNPEATYKLKNGSHRRLWGPDDKGDYYILVMNNLPVKKTGFVTYDKMGLALNRDYEQFDIVEEIGKVQIERKVSKRRSTE